MRRGTSRHSKLLMLACELDIDTYAAVGLACCMWDWVGETMPQGNIGSAPDRIIAQVIGWRGDPSKLVAAMVKVRLLDPHPVHRLIVHDWSEHSEDGVHTYLCRRRMWFADGVEPRTRQLNSTERTPTEDFYKANNPPQFDCGENVAVPQIGHVSKADVSDRLEPVRIETNRNEPKPPQPPKGEDTAIQEKSPPRRKRAARIDAKADSFDAVASVFVGRGFAGGSFRIALEAFYGHRERMGKPLTMQAAAALATKFEANGGEEAAVAAMTDSVANGWQGVFPEKVRAAVVKSGPVNADDMHAQLREYRRKNGIAE